MLAHLVMPYILPVFRWLMFHDELCNSTLSTMCKVSIMPACKRTPGTSVTMMNIHSFASLSQDIIIASSDMVWELKSSFFVYCHCSLPPVNLLAFTVPSLFSLMNIRYLSAFFLSLHVNPSFLFGTIAFLCHQVDTVLSLVHHFHFLIFDYCFYGHLLHHNVWVRLQAFHIHWFV